MVVDFVWISFMSFYFRDLCGSDQIFFTNFTNFTNFSVTQFPKVQLGFFKNFILYIPFYLTNTGLPRFHAYAVLHTHCVLWDGTIYFHKLIQVTNVQIKNM